MIRRLICILMVWLLMCAPVLAHAITFEQVGDSPAESKAAEPDSPAGVPEDNVLMKADLSDTVFDTGILRENVRSITFLNSLDDMPNGAWDISQAQDGKVMAWTAQSGGRYDLYIAGEGGVHANEDSSYLFAKYVNVTDIDFGGCFDTSGVTDMKYMFYRCEVLEELDVSGFDTSQVKDFDQMFYECKELEELDVSGFDTSRCRNFSRMFRGCERLKRLDVSGFDTANAEKMTTMFGFCYALEELDVSGFDTSGVTDMGWMFCLLKECEELDVSGFDTSGVEDMQSMFYGCGRLTELDVSGFDTARVTDMNEMFAGCSKLEKLDVSGFSTASLEDADDMFKNCERLPANIGSRFVGIAPTPAPTPSPTMRIMYNTLSRGDYGTQVKQLQQQLIDMGYLAWGEDDGSYGAKTGKAVHRFKEMNGIWHACSDTEYCQADSEMQSLLYSGDAEYWMEPDMSLQIPSGSYGQWRNNGSKLDFRMEVTNASSWRTVKAFEVYVYATDVWGDRIWGENNVKCWTTERTIAPSATAYSDYAALPDRSDIYEVHVAIKRVRYSDGTVEEVPDYDLKYTWWTVD